MCSGGVAEARAVGVERGALAARRRGGRDSRARAGALSRCETSGGMMRRRAELRGGGARRGRREAWRTLSQRGRAERALRARSAPATSDRRPADAVHPVPPHIHSFPHTHHSYNTTTPSPPPCTPLTSSPQPTPNSPPQPTPPHSPTHSHSHILHSLSHISTIYQHTAPTS